MANLGTQGDRMSAVCVLQPFVPLIPMPDGTIGQADRQHLAWVYGGLLSTSPTVIVALKEYYLSIVSLAAYCLSLVTLAVSRRSIVDLDAAGESEVALSADKRSIVDVDYDVESEV